MISTIILWSIILPIFLSVALNFSIVQNFVVDKATSILGQKIGTTISIGHIDMSLFRRVNLTDVYVEDLSGDTLLFAENVLGSISATAVIKGDFRLNRIELSGVKFFLVQDSTRTLNLAQLLDRIRRKDKEKEGSFRLSSRSVSIDDMSFVLRQYNPEAVSRGINFKDIELNNLAIKGSDFEINGDSISMSLERMSFVEKSGFVLGNFSSKELSIAAGNINLEDVSFESGSTQLDMPRLNLYSEGWEDYANFIEEVVMSGRINSGSLSSTTVGYFADAISGWDLDVYNLNLEFSGTVDNLRASVGSLDVARTSLEGDFALRGLPDINNTVFDFTIDRLSSSAVSAEYIVSHITGKQLGEGTIEKLSALEIINFEGRFKGQFTDFEAGGVVSTALGDLDLDINLRPLDNGHAGFEGHLSSLGFGLGEMLSNQKMGNLALSGSVNGFYGQDRLWVETAAAINSFVFNGYEYTAVEMDGRFENKNFLGQVRSSSEHVNFEFDGMLDFNDSIPSYNFDLRLDDVDLVQTNFNTRDSISNLSCRIIAEASGTNLDNLDGQIDIRDLLYINEVDSVSTGDITFVANNEQESKRLRMTSDFADAEFMGSSSYSDMFVYLDRALRNYLPSMSGTIAPGRVASASSLSPAQSDEYYVVKVDVKEANNVTGIFMPGLHVSKGTSAVFMLNPKRDMLSLNLASDYIERGNMFISDLNLNSRNQGDSISMFIRADELFVGGMYLTDLSVIGGARNNEITLDTRLGSSGSAAQAYISSTTLFTQDSTGLAQVRFRFNPSTFTVNNQEWFLVGRDIVADSSGVRVGGFSVRGLDQSLNVSGYASRNVNDTLRVELNNFDLAPLSELLGDSGYQINGRTSGYLNAVSALSTDVIMAEVEFDSLRINHVEVPDTRFTSQWDTRERRVSISVDRIDNNSRVIEGYFRPSDKSYSAQIGIEGLDLSLLDPVLSGVIGSTEGTATANLTLEGQSNRYDINGDIEVDSLKTKVLFTNVDYHIGRTPIQVRNNVLSFSGARMMDNQSGQGDVALSFDAGNLKNLKYELTVRATRLLALNTTINDNELFYGTVIADGLINIRGDNLGSNMFVSAQTSGPSEMYMPLSGSDSATEADFIVFAAPRAVSVEDQYNTRKRSIMSEQRRANNSGNGFNINMQLTVDPNLDFQLVIDPTVGDIIRGRGNGTINMNINPSNDLFTMYGDYEITDGSYLFTLRNIINKRFVIQPGGTIQWTGDPVDALLDITAVYELKTSLSPLLNSSEYNRRVSVDCEIQLSDRLSQPLITFDVKVPNADTETQSLVNSALNTQEMKATQFLWLLAVNSFYSDNSTSDYSVKIGATGTAVTGIEFLSNQLSNWLSSERFSLVPRYIPSSETSDDEFGFEFSAELIKNKLVIEGEGSYGNSVSSYSSSSSNFSNDLTAYWLFDQQGSLKAKAFTRTIDTFDENQGLQESGIGIFYSESFNTVKDIFRNLKNRFVRKKDEDSEDEE